MSTVRKGIRPRFVRWSKPFSWWKRRARSKLITDPELVLLQLGAGAKKAPFLLCDQRYVPVLSGRLEYPANNHCIRIRVTIGKHRALPLPQ